MKNRHALIVAAICSSAFCILCLVLIPQPKPLKFSGAMHALQFWNDQRAYPNKEIDDNAFYTAFVGQRIERSSESPLTGTSDQWRPIGPHNIGGRTLAVAVNPQNSKTIYAGSASGGLWRSYTAGKGAKAWERIPTGFPVLSVSSIAISPADSNVMLIGTGEVYNKSSSIGGLSIRTTRGSYGIGILRTTDGGASWSKTLDWSYGDLRGVQAVKMHLAHHQHVWAATTEGIYKSADTGKTWLKVSSVIMGTDLVFDLEDTNTVVAAHGNLGSTGAGIYKTTNGGATWVQSVSGLPAGFGGKIVFAQYLYSPNVLFASIGNGAVSGTWLCRSVNFGDTWTTVSTLDYSTYQGWYSHIVGVDPVDSSNVICGGVDLYKSTDGGRTLLQKSDWAAWYFGTPQPGEPEGPPDYSHADHHAIVYDQTNNNIVYFGNDGGVFCSTNGGETFEGRNGGYQTTQFYNGFSSSPLDSHLAIGGMQDNATAIYEGTVAWRRVIGGDGCMTAMSPTSTDTMYGAYQNLSLLRSTNKGATFSNITVPAGGATNFVGPYAISESHPKVLYAGREKVFRTTNGGSNWTATNANAALDGNPALAIAVAPTNPDTVYVTTTPRTSRGRMFITTNGGNVWTNITGTLPDRYMIDIAVDPKNSAVVFVTVSGFGASHVYKSTNAGTTWSDAGNGLPDVPTSAVVVSPFNSQHIYLGNDLGVYLSTDGGATWNPFSDGLHEATLIMDLSISRQNRAIRAVTHGSGVFEQKLYETPTSVHTDRLTASDFRLEQNFPNPFNPTTSISFQLSAHSQTKLAIVDNLGREAAVLVNEMKGPGAYTVQWNASNFASGTYFVRLISGKAEQVRKLVLIK